MNEPAAIPEFVGNLTGVNFRAEEDRKIAHNLEVGDGVLLERESGNPYDANAIKVLYPFAGETYFVGYVEKSVAALLARWLDEGYVYQGTVKQTMESKMTPCLLSLQYTGEQVDPPSDEGLEEEYEEELSGDELDD